MEYPARLLPHPEYGIFASNDLQRDWMMIRRTTIDAPDQLVAPDSLSQYLGMSVSICGVFMPDDVRLVPRLEPGAPVDEMDNYWAPGGTCLESQHVSCSIDDQRHPTLLPVAMWHRRPFPIVKSSPQNRATEELQGMVEIEHRPTNVNYWHCEITFRQGDGAPISSTKKAWQRNAVSFVITSMSRPGNILTDPSSVTCGTVEPVLRSEQESPQSESLRGHRRPEEA